jgi:thioredoxin 1
MRRFLIALAAFALFAVPALAKTFAPYDKSKLEAAIRSGASVVVHVHADWCPTCRSQMSTMDKLFADPALAKIQTIRVNYDRDRDFLSAYKVTKQATIIAFKDGKEVSRITYDPSPDKVASVVRSAL